MHNLKPSPIALRRDMHAKFAAARMHDLTDSNLDDAFGDLYELEYLLEDLKQSLTNTVMDQDTYFFQAAELKRKLDSFQTRLQHRRESLELASSWAKGRKLSEILDAARKEFLSIKSEMRLAFKQRGSILCADDWQSPVYDSSIGIGRNRLSQGIAEHYWDYKRDGHLDALAYEKQFLTEYVSKLGSNGIQAYLTNSGMAAFSTVLNWLSGELQMRQQVAAIVPMYFENIHLARAAFPDLVSHNASDRESLRAFLEKEDPSIVFCDAVTNCNEVIYHNISELISWSKARKYKQIALVLDTTCLPVPFIEEGLLSNLPENLIVILVESLAKHHQFGMDAVTGGVVVLHASQDLQDSFRKTRARLGTNIADTSVGALPRPNREIFSRRMMRHSRNTRMLCNKLNEIASEDGSVFDDVAWLEDGTVSAPWFNGSCFTLKLRKKFRSIKFYQELEKKVLEICQKLGHPIAFSTSFGFDVTRLYVTAPSTRFEDPFLRISVGTETHNQMLNFISILEQASFEMNRIWTENLDAPQPKKVELKAVPAVEKEKNGWKGSVFTGAEGLREYLSPENYAPTPLVELPDDLNPYRKDGVRLLAKIVPLVPLMNIKSIPAFSMLNEANLRGDLEGVKNVIESSSSNTVLSLSVISRLFGIDRTCAIVDHSIAPSLMRMLRLFGIEILQHPAAGHELFGKLAPRSERATKMGSQNGWYNPGQYSNKDNPAGFAQYLAPDIWNQTEGRLALLSCALGTCGTMVGVSAGLRAKNPEIQVLACCPVAGEAVPGPREKALLSDVTFDWQNVANQRIELGATESFISSIKLLRRGIMAGPSSGMNYAGTLRYLAEAKASGKLDEMVKANNGDMWCVFLCCDSPLPHVDEYFDALGDEYFPVVHPVPEAD